MPIHVIGQRLELKHYPVETFAEMGRTPIQDVDGMHRDEMSDLRADQLQTIAESAQQQPPNLPMLGAVLGIAMARSVSVEANLSRGMRALSINILRGLDAAERTS